MAFNLTLDLFSAIEKWIQFRKVNEWFKLIISLLCSFWLSGSFASGIALAAHRPAWEALGEGLTTASVLTVVVWRLSPLTKGMVLALPEAEAEKELETNQQVITKS